MTSASDAVHLSAFSISLSVKMTKYQSIVKTYSARAKTRSRLNEIYIT